MDIITMILLNVPVKYQCTKWQITSSYDDGTIDLINDNDEMVTINGKELEGQWT